MHELSDNFQAKSYPSWIVIKFGGTSVSNLKNWSNIAEITRQHLQNANRVLIVCSAIQNISDYLDQLIKEAIKNQHAEILERIYQKNLALALELGVDGNRILAESFAELAQLAQSIARDKKVSPQVHALTMSFGELMLTKLGEEFLRLQKINLAWQDARNLLSSFAEENKTPLDYLAAKCDYSYDPQLVEYLNNLPEVIITQGFIASNDQKETVLLGRGGSDISAAYFASKLGAKTCEIWTDVAGIYTADPRQISTAKLLKKLNYDETQEIATAGAKVLQPNCIKPLKENRIDLYIKSTAEPHLTGTLVSWQVSNDGPPIKAIINKYKIMLINITTLNMWKKAGFLADIFNCFKKHQLSVNLISTSESSLTVSLDHHENPIFGHVIDNLLADLNQFAQASLAGPCASISLVGNKISSTIYKLGDALKAFELQTIYLLSQASNDLNVTFVVDEEAALSLSKQLHLSLIEKNWDVQSEKNNSLVQHWWYEREQELLQLAENSSPIYAYDEATINRALKNLQKCNAVDEIYYSIKANNHDAILKNFYQQGLGFECVSFAEVEKICKLFPEIARQKILFTPSFAHRREYAAALELGVKVTLDNIYPLEKWPELFAGKEILIRIDPGYGMGHHQHVVTGGEDSKFGIHLTLLEQLKDLVAKHAIKVIGLHAHLGSGILQPNIWREAANLLLEIAKDFPQVRILNLGGGLGIAEHQSQNPLDLAALNAVLLEVKQKNPQLKIWLEPGRYLVAEAGIILARVTQLKSKGEINFVGIETGMNSLIRPALYGSYHEIVNLSRLNDPLSQRAHIVGPICESGDVLGRSRMLPVTLEGDVLLIANAGAYGHCMSSNYNLRQPATEIYLPEDEN